MRRWVVQTPNRLDGDTIFIIIKSNISNTISAVVFVQPSLWPSG